MDNQGNKSRKEENDIDLGSVFSGIGKGLKKLGRSIGSGGSALGTGVLNIIIFFKKRFIWFALAIAAALGWGIYSGTGKPPSYASELTGRFNFGSTLALYSTIDYLNALIASNDRGELAKLLQITEVEAEHLSAFSAEAVTDELTISELYKRNFMLYDRSYRIRTDTFWTRIIPYDKFKQSLTKFDIPLQRVKAEGTRPDIFRKIQPGFLALILTNENLKNNHSISTQMQSEEEGIILSSIRGLDTLRNVYNERLRESAGATIPGSTSINLIDRATTGSSPELELYDRVLGLKDELRSLRNFSMNHGQVIQVYASFNPVGQKLDYFRQNLMITVLSAFVMMLVILVAIEAFKAITAYERRLKTNAAE
jgi:hypothetical protein